MRRLILMVIISVSLFFESEGQTRNRAVVVDSLTCQQLANASVFNAAGKFIGQSAQNGTLPSVSAKDYPIVIRYMGYGEKTVWNSSADTIYMSENVAELPEVTIVGKQKKMLHLKAYVREYSTLASYSDTITLFREKMVDFMLPGDNKTKFKGWRYPRLLTSKSYYRFTDSDGLDSVSDKCNQHFSWSDWIGLLPEVGLPEGLAMENNATDSLPGKYGVMEVWNKKRDRINLDIDILADTTSRKWLPNLSTFFRNGNIDFERFSMRANYVNVVDSSVGPLDLAGYSYNIESRGRGRGMFMFNRYDEPFFVTTYTEVYMLDKEYITVKEAKKLENIKFRPGEFTISEPADAPALQESTLALIDRVNNIDTDRVRIAIEPDQRLKKKYDSSRNFTFGNRFLTMLKDLTGITLYKSHKNLERKWEDFRIEQVGRQRREIQRADEK